MFEAKQYAKALLSTKDDEIKQQRITDLYTKFTNYEIPILVTKKRSLEEVGFIFERINNTGTKLDIFDLMVALTWTPEFHLQIEFKKIHMILNRKNFKGLKNKILLQCISAILKESCKTKTITSLTGQNIRDNIENLNEALKRATDFLFTQLKVGSRGVLPHAHQIIPLSYFFSKVTTASSDQIISIKKWFWKTSFSARYSSGTDKNVDEDITLFNDLMENNNFNCFDKLKYSVSSEQLRNTKFSKSNPFSRALVVLLANKNPLDLTNGATIDIGVALSSFNRKEYHHVFPEAYLKNKGVDTDKISSTCNFCLLPADSNKQISRKAPSEYFESVVPKNGYKTILDSNLLPIKTDLYKKDDYDNFLLERSVKIIDFIEEQLI